MPFTFELSFTGLCFLTLTGSDKFKPDSADILLVKTGHSRNGHGRVNGNGNGHVHHHIPILSYRAKDLTSRSTRDHSLVPGPNGEQIGQLNLVGRGNIRIVPPKSFRSILTAIWRPEGLVSEPRPRSPEEEAWLDWVPALSKIDPSLRSLALLKPQEGIRKEAVTTSVNITQGLLRAGQVARGLNGNYLVWNFRREDSMAFDQAASQALAGVVLLRLEDLEQPVKIEGLDDGDGFVEFAPPSSSPSEPVRVSITNLPHEELDGSDRLDDFAGYFHLFNGVSGKPLLPEASDMVHTTTSIFCPPGQG